MTTLSRLLFSLLLLTAASACVNDSTACLDEPATPSSGSRDGDILVTFTLPAPEADGYSRSGLWKNPEATVEGNDFDNTIATLQAFVIQNSSSLVFPIGSLEVPEGTDPEGNLTFTGILDCGSLTSLPADNYRLMVLANSPELNLAPATPLADFPADQLNITWYDPMNSYRQAPTAMPMWGVATISTSFAQGKTINVGRIDLLRAVAKVNVTIDQSLIDLGYRLSDVSTNFVNLEAAILPKGWDTASSTVDPDITGNGAYFNPIFFNGSISLGGFNSSKVDPATPISFYMPEIDADRTITDLAVTLTSPKGETLFFGDALFFDSSPVVEGLNPESVLRNHVYSFHITALDLGTLSYVADCWDYTPSTIAWAPTSAQFTFTSSDNEARKGFVAFPCYPSGKTDISNELSYADYKFTLTGPEGAVWKAFLVEDGVEYEATESYIVDGGKADTPHGFFFGVGNDNKNNLKSCTTGIARPDVYNIKIGTRRCWTQYDGDTPLLDDDGNYLMTDNCAEWKARGEVPTVYLVIKIAIDGVNFTEELPINREQSVLTNSTEKKNAANYYANYQFAGDATHVEIRQLYYLKKSLDDDKLMKGNNTYDWAWWNLPMDHKDAKTE